MPASNTIAITCKTDLESALTQDLKDVDEWLLQLSFDCKRAPLRGDLSSADELLNSMELSMPSGSALLNCVVKLNWVKQTSSPLRLGNWKKSSAKLLVSMRSYEFNVPPRQLLLFSVMDAWIDRWIHGSILRSIRAFVRACFQLILSVPQQCARGVPVNCHHTSECLCQFLVCN